MRNSTDGIRKIGLVVDSTSQIPLELVRTLEVEVVPITVTIAGVDYREGIDLDADQFYASTGDPLPDITTSQPSPGAFVDAFGTVADAGAQAILCVTVDANHSGTFNSARLAAEIFDGPTVRLVDSRTISFGVTACLWQAATAIDAGASLEEAACCAERLAPAITSTFMLGSLGQARKMGRVDFDEIGQVPGAESRTRVGETAVYVTRDGSFDTLGSAGSVHDLCQMMVAEVPTGIDVRVGVCLAAPETLPYTECIEQALKARPNVVEAVRYRVGPSIAAHTGPGTAGLFYWPA